MSQTTTLLPNPHKSTKDLKEYRSLRLANGLRVLLIADTRYPLDKLDQEEIEAEEEEEFEDQDEEDGEEEGEDEDDDDEEDDDDDGDNFEQEEGGCTSRPKHLTGLKKSAAGLCIGVGSFSDPEELPGLAHFLEHMVFMGSEKFPDENSFDNFIQSHGGTDNASTDCETTVFYFETQRKHFREGLDRFAQFFICPLMKKEAMQRERESVDSEFQMALPSDYLRKQQLFGSMAKKNHPMGKFMWGNRASLSPSNMNDDQVHEKLMAFKNRHYTAQYMTLVVQSQETLDSLQSMVEMSFSGVPNNGLERETFHNLTEPFKTDKFNKIIKVCPVQNVYQLDLNWAWPPMLDKYKVKPLHYISWIIGHEGKGSLISYLRKKVWALNVTAGNAGDGFEYNSTYTLFTVTIELTKSGHQHVDDVIDAVFSYIHMIWREGPNERIYNEIKKIEELDFDFGEESQPCENVETICENMHFYPPERYLDGDDLMFEYDPELIEKCYRLLTDEVIVFITAREYANICDQVEPWFDTKYKVEEIPEERKKIWRTIEPFPDFHLPNPNLYIATDTSIKTLETDENSEMNRSNYPIRIIETRDGELFYKNDEIFKQPRANINFHFCSPLPLDTPESAVAQDIMIGCVAQLMTEDTYAADLTQISFSFYSSERGILLKISGLNDKLSLLFEEILKHFKSLEDNLNQDLFDAIKEQTKKNYFNTFIKPAKAVRELRLSLIQDVYFGNQVRHSVIPKVDMAMVKAFATEFKRRVFIQGLVQGNMTPEEARNLFRTAQSTFSCENNCQIIPEIRCNKIPLGSKVLRMKGINPKDTNTVITNYYQGGAGTLKYYVILEIVCMLMEEPVFDVLRTREQLGYSVFSMLRNTYGVLGFSITVNSQESKYDVDHVNDRMEAFLKWFVDEKVQNLAEDELQDIISVLIKMKKAADVTLEEETSRNWKEILSREYLFDRHKQEIELLEKYANMKHVRQTLKDLVHDQRRKLSVQVMGGNGKEEEKEDLVLDPDREYAIQLIKENPDFASDLEGFKNELETFPILHITH